MVNSTPNTLADRLEWSGCCGPDSATWRRFADGLMTLERGCLGWQPSTALDAWWRQGLVCCLYRSGELVGYCAGHASRTAYRIWQVGVRRDARLIEHGLMLVAAHEARARGLRSPELSLWCAADIEATVFWECLRFSVVQQRYKSRLRCRLQYRYARRISYGLVQPRRDVRPPLFGGAIPRPQLARLVATWEVAGFDTSDR